MPFAAVWVDLGIITLSEVSQRETNIFYSLFVESRKKGTKSTYFLNRRRLRHGKQTYDCQREVGGGIEQEAGIKHIHYIYRIDNQKDIRTGNYTQYYVIINKGKEYEKEYICAFSTHI